MAIAHRHFGMVLEDIGQGVHPTIVSQVAIPLFTNKMIGLKRVERNRTTQVNLVDFLIQRDNEGDSLSERTLSDDGSNHDNSDSSGSSGADSPPNQDTGHQEEPNNDQNNDHQNPPVSKENNCPESSKRKRSHDNDHDQGRKKTKLDKFKMSQSGEQYQVKTHDEFSSFSASPSVHFQTMETEDQEKGALAFTHQQPKRKCSSTGNEFNEELGELKREKEKRRRINAREVPNHLHGEMSLIPTDTMKC
ncbi:hypothetical protein BVRB_1g011270 [Beta vulgaris subsp. vulgaris]|nr:hypothetical protein BVRB_1g011270 [Beta vulgaris subsp. vulgaris]